MHRHYRTCNLCEAMCGIEIQHDGDRIVSIRGDAEDPFSRGYICPKAAALQDLHDDPDRLKHPVRRTRRGWERVGWHEAFDEVAGNLKRIQAAYGASSVATYFGNPTVHNHGSVLFAPGFVASLGSRRQFSATSVDQLAHHCAGYFMFGHMLLLPVPDVDRTQFLLMLGANPLVSNGSLMTAPDVGARLKAIRERGGTIVLVDPRKTETAGIADRHLFIKPGTDVFLLLALLQVIYAGKLQQPGRLESFTDGLDTIGSLVSEFTPERVSAMTGVDATTIRDLAREYATTRPAVCYGRVGVSTQEFGGLCQWLIQVLNVVTGNLDREGGALFTKPAFDIVNAPATLAPRGSFGRWRTRVRDLPEFGGELPVAAMAEEILTPGRDQIKALVTSAGNPVLSTPNGRQLERALESLEFMASIDWYINETTRHANVILPPPSSLERDHYDVAFHLLAIRNTAKYSPALFAPPQDARHEWEILLELQTRMESTTRWSSLAARLKRAVVHRVGPAGLLGLGLRFGPYKLTLKQLKLSPHGIDLGPLKPCLPARLGTPNKRIQLAPDVFVDDMRRAKERLRADDRANGHLLLIGRRQLRSNNSWMHNAPRMVKGRNRCTLLINPQDANRHGITEGQLVSVSSRVGVVELPAEITSEIMPGVVSIPHGWGHDRPGIQLGVATQHAGASINDLTDETAIDALLGTAAFSGIPVMVTARSFS